MRSNERLTSVEIQAVTVEDAIRLALDQLQLGREDVDIEILSDAGTEEDEEALVRVTAKGMASAAGFGELGRSFCPIRRTPRISGSRRSAAVAGSAPGSG